jgi:hypothetical protein
MHPHAPSERSTRRRAWGPLALVAVLALFAAACGDDDAGALSTSDVWARTSPAMADAGAVYMTVESDDGVSIVGASVDESVAALVELHETTMADGAMEDTGEMDDEMADTSDMANTSEMDDAMEDDGHSDGAMMMQPVEAIEVPAGGSVSLEPGGIHIMLLELAEPLEAGNSFDLTLILDDGEEHQVSVEVRDA